jgi:hypothetical protein
VRISGTSSERHATIAVSSSTAASSGPSLERKWILDRVHSTPLPELQASQEFGNRCARTKESRTNGLSGKARQFYQWDYIHRDIELYNSKGRHLGTIDPTTGEFTEQPVRERSIKRFSTLTRRVLLHRRTISYKWAQSVTSSCVAAGRSSPLLMICDIRHSSLAIPRALLPVSWRAGQSNPHRILDEVCCYW